MPPSLAPQVLDTALDAVGNTPLIRLDKIAGAEGLKCNLLGKVEFFSAGGSVKDRIAKRMVEEAEKDGTLVPGKSVIIEPTSGNTGIGLALAGAIKGYPVIITLPEKMSLEKEATLRALGAEVVRTPTAATWDSEESHIGVAKKLQRNIPHAVILDQYSNPNNPLAHELGTGPEILAAVATLDNSSKTVDVCVAGAGTGGTVTGVSRALKASNKDCVIVAVDPKGSILAVPDTLNDDARGEMYVVEGIGYDFVPEVLDRDKPTVDVWVKMDDSAAFTAAHRLMRLEGLLVGGSSGTALAGALQYLKSEEGWARFGNVEGKNVVVILPDGLRNYIGKPWFLDATLRAPATPLANQISQILRS
ncbi:pyridoxal phosphate-dependent enzyme, beta subunit [Exidia glandulosa HHB12029]|uniref:cystathionine beta-synthase n=1 Tax=Exidia glandulosa HHB12029 TaxID=1314781 RepID=A0A165MZP8_EXIGL|nr:pyridoxal phosphate-dependent enzyme, beta subunit [Exidia glandulosa HHB12029]